MTHRNAVILFDGVCNLCNGLVQYIIKHDHQKKFMFASLQSNYARNILESQEIKTDSIVLIENGKIYLQSTAVLRIARSLGGISKLLYGFIIVPSFIRNIVYRYIASHRYRWFGKRVSCMVPTDDLKNRFISEKDEDFSYRSI